MAQLKCSRCGSEKIMRNLKIQDRGDGNWSHELEVEIDAKPEALVFKDTHREALRATVCGKCGIVALTVDNPQALWNIYSQQQQDESE